jgi:hypothetical protein
MTVKFVVMVRASSTCPVSARRATDTDRKSLLALRGVGPESEAESVRFHGRRVTKVAPFGVDRQGELLPEPCGLRGRKGNGARLQIHVAPSPHSGKRLKQDDALPIVRGHGQELGDFFRAESLLLRFGLVHWKMVNRKSRIPWDVAHLHNDAAQ